MKKRVLSVLLTAVMGMSLLAGCGNGEANSAESNGSGTTPAAEKSNDTEGGSDKAANADTKVWKLAFAQTTEHPQYKVMDELSKEFYERTDGRYDIQIFPNETLGAQRETFEQVQSGIIEMTIVNNTHPGSVSDYFKAFDMPFVFDDIDQAIDFVKTDAVMETVKGDTEQYGFTVATYLPAGTRSMFTSDKAITCVDDMKGMKIRTMESDMYVAMMDAFGGSATPMAMGEMYTAIQSGVVDGAENNEVTYVEGKYYEVAPYWSQTNHLIVPDWLLINTDTYNSLSDEDRAVFDELCAQAIDKVNDAWESEVEELMASLDTSKVTITSDVDIKSFQDAIAPANQKTIESNEKIKEVYDAIMAYKGE